MSPTIKAYTPQLSWDDRAGYWVAEVREIPTCSADGSTPAEAVSNLEAAFAVLKEAYAEENTPLPPPDPMLPIRIGQLEQMAGLLNLSNLARRAGFSPQTLASKLKRKTEFTAQEARRIAAALRVVFEAGSPGTEPQPVAMLLQEPAAGYGARAKTAKTPARAAKVTGRKPNPGRGAAARRSRSRAFDKLSAPSLSRG